MFFSKSITNLAPLIPENLDRRKKELAYMVKIAIGHRSVEEFTKTMRMVNSKPLVSSYCSKYHKNHKYILQEYERINNYTCEVAI